MHKRNNINIYRHLGVPLWRSCKVQNTNGPIFGVSALDATIKVCHFRENVAHPEVLSGLCSEFRNPFTAKIAKAATPSERRQIRIAAAGTGDRSRCEIRCS